MNYTLITGASGILGKCFCKEYARQNNNLILTGRSLQKLTDLKNELASEFNNIDIQIYACQMEQESSREEFFAFLGGFVIEKLILVAGNDNQMAFSNYTQDKIITQIRANFESQVCLTNYVINNMVKGGTILVISSLTAIMPMPYFAIYSSCKSAQLSFFKAIKKEYKHLKITIALPSSMPTREDIIQDIKLQGVTGKLASQSPQKVARVCVKKASKNKTIVIIGFYNKLVYFFNKITPYSLKSKIIEKKFKNKTKENF